MESTSLVVTPETVEEILPSQAFEEQQQQQQQQDAVPNDDVVMSEAEAPASSSSSPLPPPSPTPPPPPPPLPLTTTTPALETSSTSSKPAAAYKRKREEHTTNDDESDVQGVTHIKKRGTQKKPESKQKTGSGAPPKEIRGGIDSSLEMGCEKKKQTSAVSSRRANRRVLRVNSYYTFIVLGDTQEERFENITKVISMSPVKRPFSATSSLIITEHVLQNQDGVKDKDIDEAPSAAAAAAAPPMEEGNNQNRLIDPRGIKDILFFNTDFQGGCFTVRNKSNKREEDDNTREEATYLQEMYDGLLDIGEKISHEKYSKMTNKLKMNLHIKSWFCVRPFYETGGVPPTNFIDKGGISSYRIFRDGTGLFQFDSNHTSSTSTTSAEIFGVMHKSMCIQIKGETVQKILEDKKNSVVASFGNIIYRSKWRNDEKRASRYFKYIPIGKNNLSDKDILSIVKTPNMFVVTHFNDITREYGVVRSKDKIVPCSIIIYNGGFLPPKEGEEEQGMNLNPVPVQFTAITQSEFNTEKVKDGMNSLKTSKRRRTTTTTKSGESLSFDRVSSTSFTFPNMPRELVRRIASQSRVKMLKAAKIEGGKQDNFRGVVKTFSSVRGINLANRIPGQLVPADSNRTNSMLNTMKDMKLEFNIVRTSKTPSSYQQRQGIAKSAVATTSSLPK